jgi:tetratricopeptide (TPR) repeat protein
MAFALVLRLVVMLAWQPDTSMLGQLFEEALERNKQKYGATDTRTVQAARDLGLFLSKQGVSAGAQKALAEVVRLDETAIGPNASQTLADVAALANVSPPRQAEPLWRRAAESPEQKVAARALAALGQSRETAGDQAGAANFYRQALVKEEAAFGKAATTTDKAEVAILLGGLAQVFAQVVDPPEGIATLRRALAIDRTVLGARHPETATVEANLAGVLLDANEVDESVRLITEAISNLEETMGEDHPRVAISSTILAFGLRAKGDNARSERNYRRALAIDERIYGPRNAQTLNDVKNLAEFLRERGKIPEAAVLEKRLANGAK